MPISQSLITPDLALAFDIKPPNSSSSLFSPHHNNHHNLPPPLPTPSSNHNPPHVPPNPQNSSEFADSSDLGGSGTPGSGPSDEPARTLKRPRLVWTPQLHKRFVDAVAHLGIKNAVPKTIMQLMSVDGLTRENVASHLQKYRLYLKRMQGLSNSGGGNGGVGVNGGGMVDPATDHLFASGPVPSHFLPFVPVAAMHHHNQHQQIAGPAALVHPQIQMHNYRQMGHFGSAAAAANGQYEHNHFLGRQVQQVHHHRMGGGGGGGGGIGVGGQPFVEDLESPNANGGSRKVLTLFPTGDD